MTVISQWENNPFMSKGWKIKEIIFLKMMKLTTTKNKLKISKLKNLKILFERIRKLCHLSTWIFFN